jgi:hypothetical protein
MGPSIGDAHVSLLYGAYMDHFWVTLRERVPGLRALDLLPEYRVQRASKARVHNWLLCGDRVRRVRFTYFDGGAAGQAFNSLLYPDPRFSSISLLIPSPESILLNNSSQTVSQGVLESLLFVSYPDDIGVIPGDIGVIPGDTLEGISCLLPLTSTLWGR